MKFLSRQQPSEALIAEARAVAALDHPGVARLYDAVLLASAPVLVSEYVPGESLRQKLDRGALELPLALDVARQVADALHAAHSAGHVHCDLSPNNILVTPEGQTKILDFGLARRRGSTAAHTAGTVDAIGGTPGYMAPEQILGGVVGPQTDLFALGVILFEMVTGRRPFDGPTHAAVARAVTTAEPPPLARWREDVPLGLERIVRHALEKHAEDRYDSAAALLAELRALRVESAVEACGVPSCAPVAPGPAPPGRDARASRRELLAPVIVGCALFSALALTGRVLAAAVSGIAGGLLVYAWERVRRRPAPLLAPPPGLPFRGLLPFLESDRDRFFGRGGDVAALLQKLRQLDFVVLYGDSGCGKTSLLRAGVIPSLWEAGHVALYARVHGDPIDSVCRACEARSGRTRRADEPPLDYVVRACAEHAVGVVFVWDQFEELLVSGDPAPLASFVDACLRRTDLPIRTLVSIRSDFLYRIEAAFEGIVDDPLRSAHLHELRPFTAAQASEVICESARTAGLPLEPALVSQVVQDLAVHNVVLASELQIVGERLQSRRIHTLAAYRAAGRKEALVHSFLDDVIRASGDPRSAQLVLRALISDENARLALSLQEIARRTQLSSKAVGRLVSLLTEARLVREVEGDTATRYELLHEYLIDRINRITGHVLDATQRANRLLKQYLSSHAVDPKTRIPLREAWFIRRHSDLERGERERKLLRHSLRTGLAKLLGASAIFALGALSIAALLSIRDEWQPLQLRDGHTAAVRRVAFSPDGTRLVSVGEDRRVIVWDFARRVRLATFTDHGAWVTALAISPDGRYFATGGEDQKVRVWDLRRLVPVAVLEGHTTRICGMAFSDDGRLLASGGDRERGGPTFLWQVGSWRKLRSFPHGIVEPNNPTFISDRHLLMTSGVTFDMTTGQRIDDVAIDARGNSRSFSPDRSQFVSIDHLGAVLFRDRQSGRLLLREVAHRDHGRSVAFSADGRYAASAAEDVLLWDARTHARLSRFEHASIVWSVTFSPDSRWLVSAHADGTILIWDPEKRERAGSLNGHSGAVSKVAASPDGRLLASAGADRSVIVWDARAGEKRAVLLGHSDQVNDVAFGPNASWLVSCGQFGEVLLWDLPTALPQPLPSQTSDACYAAAVSPDGRWIATSHSVFDATNHRVVLRLPANSALYDMAFSGDSQSLAVVATAGQITIWDTTRWQRREERPVDRDRAIVTGDLSRDGERIVTGDPRGAVRLWRLQPLREEAVLGPRAGRVAEVAFSPDGRLVLAADRSRGLRLWDVARRRLTAEVAVDEASLLTAVFSPEGRRIFSGAQDGAVRIHTRRRTLWGVPID